MCKKAGKLIAGLSFSCFSYIPFFLCIFSFLSSRVSTDSIEKKKCQNENIQRKIWREEKLKPKQMEKKGEITKKKLVLETLQGMSKSSSWQGRWRSQGLDSRGRG